MAALLPNSCFIHIPRTGGSYIRGVLKDLGLFQGETGSEEDRPFQYRNHSGYHKTKEYSGDRKLFTFVREDGAWLKSLYTTRKDTGHWPLLGETDRTMYFQNTDCESWIQTLYKYRPFLYHEVWKEYGVYNPDVMVGHTETLDLDLKAILRKLEGIS